ncbi:hypothetical protein NKR23_g8238 [Pleurostoma richardsiae]|uniref:Uncharacterized protein n=1 Tax=Pleurostoma richardsiae TaxID=41990 RepID=A0AA38RKP0_9PEZI|nr:hypothetical protein NKR23_g8238 [Pleurostoma richardsiae]
MASPPPQPVQLELLEPHGDQTIDGIRPLHIIKRADSVGRVSSARTSVCSTGSVNIRDRIPNQQLIDRPLTIPKRRGNRGDQIFGCWNGFPDGPSPVGLSMTPPGKENIGPRTEDEATPRPYRYNSNQLDSPTSRQSAPLKLKTNPVLPLLNRHALLRPALLYHPLSGVMPRNPPPVSFSPGLLNAFEAHNHITGRDSLDSSNSMASRREASNTFSGESLPSLTPGPPCLAPSGIVCPVIFEVSARLMRLGPDNAGPLPPSLLDGDDFGYLYNLQVDILPTPCSRILEILQRHSDPVTLSANSTILLLALIGLDRSSPATSRAHIRQRSDDLMEDLEHHLGSAQTEYLQVHLRYNHSAFSASESHREQLLSGSNSSGLVKSTTTLATVATAVIERHNASSLWSPPPAPAFANRLLDIVAAN